jgi:hypothetical protein
VSLKTCPLPKSVDTCCSFLQEGGGGEGGVAEGEEVAGGKGGGGGRGRVAGGRGGGGHGALFLDVIVLIFQPLDCPGSTLF